MSEASPAAPGTPAAAPVASMPAANQGQLAAAAAATPEQAALAADALKAEVAKAEAAKKESSKKKYDLKVNGKSKSVELDLSDDKAVQDYLQKAMAADERFQEAATLRKDVQLLVKTLKENPLAILTHPGVGVDVKKLAEMVINQELEDMQKSPEQKKLEALEKELAQEREAKTKMEEQARQAAVAQQESEQFQQIDDKISTALSSTDLPKTPYVVKRISDAMISAFDMGYRDIEVEQIIPIVEKQLKEEMGQWFDSSSEDALEKLMGKNNIDRMRKKRIAAQKKAPATAEAIKATSEAAKPKAKEEPAKPTKRFEDLFGKF